MSDLTAGQIDALLDALRTASSLPHDSGGALTAEEIATELGCGIRLARQKIRAALIAKRAECVKVRRTRIDGLTTTVPAYRFTGDSKDLAA